jgi:hypothetical protein
MRYSSNKPNLFIGDRVRSRVEAAYGSQRGRKESRRRWIRSPYQVLIRAEPFAGGATRPRFATESTRIF